MLPMEKTMIALNNHQLKSLLKVSEMHGKESAEVQSVTVVYLPGGDSGAYAGPGIYWTLEGENLEDGAYLALDSQDEERAITILEAQQQQNLREYRAIEESICRDDITACKSRASCIQPHRPTWQLKVPSNVKPYKSTGRCLCDEFRQTVVDIELENPID